MPSANDSRASTSTCGPAPRHAAGRETHRKRGSATSRNGRTGRKKKWVTPGSRAPSRKRWPMRLTDSPVGLAAWIVEKFHTWSDHSGDLDGYLGKDAILTNIMLYWVTGAIGSSFWPYYARMHGPWPMPEGQTSECRRATPSFRRRFCGRRARSRRRCTAISGTGRRCPRAVTSPRSEQPELLAREDRETSGPCARSFFGLAFRKPPLRRGFSFGPANYDASTRRQVPAGGGCRRNRCHWPNCHGRVYLTRCRVRACSPHSMNWQGTTAIWGK